MHEIDQLMKHCLSHSLIFLFVSSLPFTVYYAESPRRLKLRHCGLSVNYPKFASSVLKHLDVSHCRTMRDSAITQVRAFMVYVRTYETAGLCVQNCAIRTSTRAHQNMKPHEALFFIATCRPALVYHVLRRLMQVFVQTCKPLPFQDNFYKLSNCKM